MKTLLIAMSLMACHKNPDKHVDWVAQRVESKLELRASSQRTLNWIQQAFVGD